MPMRDCIIVAIEGTHACGKTTLVHALTANYRERGVNVACTGEPARTSPFAEETVIFKRGEFDLPFEVDLFGAQLTTQLRAARHHELLICDKTIMNVAAYADMLLKPEPGTREAAVVGAMTAFCAAWSYTYDAVVYCPDRYDQPNDPFRAKVAHLQDETARAVHNACTSSGAPVLDLPLGLSVAQRVAWVAERVDPLLRGGAR
ncbi:putative ATPase [Allocatelliglobosispora scoriae]|uniref:Putative ATPase n=1 Tax=Allocatelliglobosispora scoriae TaxID=643052 RepID=A0A841C2R0_9ACTN|nr:AAA family ATPase [Allocatelliglobosispora scoriae]MBB5874644.1 putative ATPase [Allocatelliglobosispora scoriae]